MTTTLLLMYHVNYLLPKPGSSVLLKVITVHQGMFLKHKSSLVLCQILSCKFAINK